MKQINICGVPEHFNLPWCLSIENQCFINEKINLQWTDVPEGTGKMCQMLRDGTTDIAIILTEGILKDIVAGNSSKIVQIYVQTPLIWGVFVASNSNYHKMSDLENKKAAISRFGSGSHLMAIVNAKKQNWKIENLDFDIVNTIEGAIESLTFHKADYFMWEKFMTKPLVDAGIFRKIDDCPTPWPCFVVAVRTQILEDSPNQIAKILKIINHQTKKFKSIPNIDSQLASKYNQKINDIQDWLSTTTWSQKNLTEIQFNQIQNQLLTTKIIDKKLTFAKVVQHI